MSDFPIYLTYWFFFFEITFKIIVNWLIDQDIIFLSKSSKMFADRFFWQFISFDELPP